MRANMGFLDRVIRIVIGVALIAVGIIFRSWWGLIGIVPLATAFVSFCPLYALIGVSTCRVKTTTTTTSA